MAYVFTENPSEFPIAVLGAGVMGHGIALVAAQAGHPVWLFDLHQQVLDNARRQLEKFTQQSVEKGKIAEATRTELLGRLRYTTDILELDAHLVIEAVVEQLEVKQELFRKLESRLPKSAVFASNTSSLPITRIAGGLQHPERFAGLHFFNPAPLMKLVEVVAGAATDASVVTALAGLVARWGKVPAIVKDTPGFIVNRVARSYYLESLRCVEEGAADIAAIDRLMEAQGFKMGPFRLMDLIGVETNHAVSRTVWEANFQPAHLKPSVLQQQKVDAGHFGRKTGKGFYNYEQTE